MGLGQYHKKRDFSKTPEPRGKLIKDKHHLFIIQKHAASHLHYDFRLELDGVLKSWAVPKGPCLDPKVKRLAMHVEDHPIAYGSFEGIIPKGQYGGGTVMLWDKGRWESLDDNPKLAYQKGHLRFNLIAEKLQGRWDLIRFKDDKHWFLIKHQDSYVRLEQEYDVVKALDKSVVSNQTITEIANNYTNIWRHKKNESVTPRPTLPTGLKKSPFLDIVRPQLAILINKAPNDARWLHEIKFDGYRIIAYKQGKNVCLKSRTNKDWTAYFPAIAAAIKKLPIKNIIVDGEIVVLDKQGKSNFQLLQNSLDKKTKADYIYYLFDLLYLDAYDLRTRPLLERKLLLKEYLPENSKLIQYSDHIIENGETMFEQSCEFGLEGIICKKIDSPYQSTRNKNWLKVKCLKRQEFVIGGYTNPKGERSHFGALLLGYYDKKKLVYAGNVGTGFNEASLKQIYKELVLHNSDSNPFTTKPPGYEKIHWVKPILIAEVEFSDWTDDLHLRHPSFKGLRLDKKANTIVKEHPAALVTPIPITNANKILYSEDKITKADLFDYYDAVSAYILPFIVRRPITLLRCPADYQHCFYQRHPNKAKTKALRTIEITSGDETEPYLYLTNKQGLLTLVQMGVLEIHPWGSTVKHPNKPDIIVIDLDPAPDVSWSQVINAAFEIRDHLADYQLQSFVKTTGGKGLHIVIPILPEYHWEDVKEFTRVFVQFLEKLKPNDYTSSMAKNKRMGKIFIDYLRNQHAATAIAAYSTRARLHAPVSTPLAWEELSTNQKDNIYTIKTLPSRLAKLAEDPWAYFWQIKQSLRLE